MKAEGSGDSLWCLTLARWLALCVLYGTRAWKHLHTSALWPSVKTSCRWHLPWSLPSAR